MSRKLVLRKEEGFDEDTCTFIPGEVICTLIIEHSLLSISKWEAIYHKPFLSTDKDFDMIKEYIKCMTINSNIPEDYYDYVSPENVDMVTEYISDSHTATWFNDNQPAQKGGKMTGSGEVITAEIVYYWMISMNIPVQFEKWHLNRLLTLIRVISLKNDPKGAGRKMSASERRALNKMRQAKYHTRG